ncbi:MAG: flavin monoamine oxidase family protein [Limisphaerales bacterium]
MIVVGGGIAGLAAARELARNGIAVTVIEAKNRFGGRIHTIRAGPFPVELGAEFVHGENQPLLKIIHEANLSIHAAPELKQLFKNGKLEPIIFWDLIGEIISRVNPREGDCSFAEFLAREISDEQNRKLARDFVEGFDAAHTERISAHALLRAQFAAEQMNGAQQSRVNEGYSALIDFLEREIENHGGGLLKETIARRIYWKTGAVEVRAQRGENVETHNADAAILALPLGILKTNEVIIEPLLAEKQEAIRELEFGNAMKMTFLFQNQWWKNFGLVHALDEPMPTWWDDPRGPMLTGWAGGPKADALRHCSPPELETLGLKILGRIFSESAASLRKQLIASHTWNWARDPQVRGAYSYIPVNGLDLPKRLAAPVADTLFFAGEATVSDAQTGTVFGAFESGLRAAREILVPE